jgi:hypothetical protein
MVDVLELLYNNAADKVSPRLMPTQDQRDMVNSRLVLCFVFLFAFGASHAHAR